jgi:YegS/Rv2252/BmrU family lipid kinase
MQLLPEVVGELNRRGLEHRIVQTTSLEHGVSEAERAAASGEIPVVMSGDGLIGQIGGALAETGHPVGIIPGGRGNDLARVLGIPKEPAESVAMLAEHNIREIDVGVANDRRFLCVASCGFDSVVNRRANEARLVKGNLVYAYAAIRTLASWKPATFTVRLDDREPIVFEGYSVAAANSKAFGGGMFVAPHARLDDGLLDVITVSDVSKLRYVRGLPKAFKGTHVDSEEVGEERAATVEISANRPFELYADGEHLTDLPARLTTLKRALRVIAPPEPA